MKMDFDAMLRAVLEQVCAAGIPAAARIDPQVRLNTRAKKRYGRCICKNGWYEIELSAHLVHADSSFVYTVLAHEVLHTCPGCMNHGPLWKQYAARTRYFSPQISHGAPFPPNTRCSGRPGSPRRNSK